jgi:NitT/TauT family transport system permease protein
MQKTFNKLILSLILPVLLLIVWQLSASQVQNAAVLPTIGRVLENFVHATDNFIGLGSIPRILLIRKDFMIKTNIPQPMIWQNS